MALILSNQVSAFDLNREALERQQRHRASFEEVLESCYSRIRRCAYVGRTECSFAVPEMVPGRPRYDVNRCVRFVLSNLQGNGFRVSYYFPRFLRIEWGPEQPGPPRPGPSAIGIGTLRHDADLPVVGPGAPPPPPGAFPSPDDLHPFLQPPPAMSAMAYPAPEPPLQAMMLQPPPRAPPSRLPFRAISEFKPSGKLVLTL